MAFELTTDQKAFLADPKRVKDLAEWCRNNTAHYAVKAFLKKVDGFTVDRLAEALTSSTADVGLLARLINSYRSPAKS